MNTEASGSTQGWDHKLLVVALWLWGLGCFAGDALAYAGLLATLVVFLKRAPWGAYDRVTLCMAGLFALSIGWAVRGYLSSTSPVFRAEPWTSMIWIAFPLALWMVSHSDLQIPDRLYKIVGALLVISCVFAIVQHLVALPYPDWLRQALPVRRVHQPHPLGGFRGGGLHFHRLKLAHTALPLGIAYLASLPSTRESRRGLARWAWWIVPPTYALALYAGWVKASWIALGAAAFGWVAMKFGLRFLKARRLGLILCGIALVAVLVGTALGLLLEFPDDRSWAWSTAIELWGEAPWWGIGVGHYPALCLENWGAAHPRYPLLHWDAHSLWLHPLVERGLLGGLVFAIPVIWWARKQIALYAEPPVIALVLSFLALGLVHYLPAHPVVIFAYAIAFALVVGRKQASKPGP